MIIQTVLPEVLAFFGKKPVVVEPEVDPLSSDAGLLPIREFAEWTEVKSVVTVVFVLDPLDTVAIPPQIQV